MSKRNGTCTAVLNGDTIVLDGATQVRYCNVWAPATGTPLGDALTELNRGLVLGKTVQYQPNGHLHWDGVSIVADVYLEDKWLNQELRFWLNQRVGSPQWVGGIPGAENPHTEEAGA